LLPFAFVSRIINRRFGNEDTQNPPLVLFVGLGGTIASWPFTFLSTMAATREVIAFDYRNIGLSTETQPTGTLTIQDLAHDSAYFIEALRLPQPPDVFGLSMGAMVVAALLADHSNLVSTAVAAHGSAGGPFAELPSEDVRQRIFSNGSQMTWLNLTFDLSSPQEAEAACYSTLSFQASRNVLQAPERPGAWESQSIASSIWVSEYLICDPKCIRSRTRPFVLL
jgi:pimeloyl-ACP methyl ester carboxylesterase